MAGLTKEQRLAKAQAEAENKEENKVESIVEKVESKIQEAKVKKTVKKDIPEFDDEDMISVMSIAGGRTQLFNPEKPYDETVWDGFGDIQEVRYGTLESRRKVGDELFKRLLYVMDEDAVIALRLEKTYANLSNPEELLRILDKPEHEVVRFIEMASPEVKSVLREILSNKLERKESINFFSLKIIAEKLGFELNLDL